MQSKDYFDKYGPIQGHKHALLKRYLDAWYPILSSWSGRVLYIETHAGKGVHKGGQYGSPLVAMESLLSHSRFSTILSKCEIHFYLMEIDPAHAASLKATIDQLLKNPKVSVQIECCDFSARLRDLLEELEAKNRKLAPAFVFIDPFGYDIPVDLVRRLMKHRSCEVMVNFMAQPVGRAINDPTKAANLDALFGSSDWRPAGFISDFDERKEFLVKLYEKAVGAVWTTKLRLTGQTDYTLMHFTNNDEGRSTMKKAVWAITEDLNRAGTQQLFLKDDPNQMSLIDIEPDLSGLQKDFQECFWGQSFTYGEAMKWLLAKDYNDVHLHQVFRKGREEEWLETEYRKPFGPAMADAKMKIIGGCLFE